MTAIIADIITAIKGSDEQLGDIANRIK